MVTIPNTSLKFVPGWIPDRADPRDLLWTPDSSLLVPTTKPIDLRPKDGPVFDQGHLGACAPHSGEGLMQFISLKLFADQFQGSRLDLYYYCRLAMGQQYVSQDSGTQIRTVMKVLSSRGTPLESLWPYDISKFTQQPPAACDADAGKHMVTQYMRVQQDVDHLKACLLDGYPFLFGFRVYQSLMTQSVADTGVMPMPVKGDKFLGGHAVMGCGFLPKGTVIVTPGGQSITLAEDYFVIRNSWGVAWGLKGYFLMPAAFIVKPGIGPFRDASDFWTARVITDGDKASS